MADRDAVDDFVSSWRRERPDLDFAPMATIGRLGRLHLYMGRAIETVFAGHALQIGEFDVLAALRRSGPPYEMTPTALARTLMLSPAGMTNRLDRLEAAGLVERRQDRDDRRSSIITLTEAGNQAVDAAVTAHVANEAHLLAGLTRAEQRSLDQLLRKLLRHVQSVGDAAD